MKFHFQHMQKQNGNSSFFIIYTKEPAS